MNEEYVEKSFHLMGRFERCFRQINFISSIFHLLSKQSFEEVCYKKSYPNRYVANIIN